MTDDNEEFLIHQWVEALAVVAVCDDCQNLRPCMADEGKHYCQICFCDPY